MDSTTLRGIVEEVRFRSIRPIIEPIGDLTVAELLEGGEENPLTQALLQEAELKGMKLLMLGFLQVCKRNCNILSSQALQTKKQELLVTTTTTSPPPQIDNELLRGVKRYLEASQGQLPRATPTETPASLGYSSKQELMENNSFQKLSGSPGQPAVLDKRQLGELTSLSNEHQVVAFLTPFFEQAIGQDSDIQVINSEQYPWLETSSQLSRFNQKPDNIFCNKAIYSGRAAFNTGDQQLLRLRRDRDKFGVISSWRLRDCIDAIGEGKVKIDNAAFGEVINYARHICYQKGAPLRTKLVLYDKSEFWLVSAVKGAISLVQTCGWGVPGSSQILKDFIHVGRSPWIKLLNSACAYWKLTVSSDSFLGMGRFGRVFKVLHKGKESEGARIMALKLVLPGRQGEGPLELLKEKECLESAAQVLPNAVVHVQQFHDFGDDGAALLLQDAGGNVPKSAWQQVFETLGRLHQANIVHGDPRLSNVVFVRSSVRWIDFRSSAILRDPTSTRVKQRDMATLLKSCCDEEEMPLSIAEQVVAQYNGTSAGARTTFDAFVQEKTRYRLTIPA